MGPAGGDDGRRRGDLGKDVRSAGDSGPAAGPATPVVRAPRAHDRGGTGDGCDVSGLGALPRSRLPLARAHSSTAAYTPRQNASSPPENRKSGDWVMTIATRSRPGSLTQDVPKPPSQP